MLVIVVIAVALAAGVIVFVISESEHVAAPAIDPEAERRALRRWIARHPRIQRFLRRRLDREAAGGFMLSVAFLVTFTVVLGLGLLLRLVNHSPSLARADKSVSEWGADHASSRAVDMLRWITQIGSTAVVLLMLVAAAAFDYARRKNATVFGFVAAVGIGQLLLSNGVKLLVRRPRPEVLHLVAAHGYSFPSGHTCAAGAATSAVALLLSRGRSRHSAAVLAGAAALLAIGVAASRALLGVHWLSDVLAGLTLGWGWFLLVATVFGGRRQQVAEAVPPKPVGAST